MEYANQVPIVRNNLHVPEFLRGLGRLLAEDPTRPLD